MPGALKAYAPDPLTDADHDGVTDAARVGVPGLRDAVGMVPRMPNLTADERAVETRFATAYEQNPNEVVAQYRAQVAASALPNVFSTDDAKLLSPDYAQSNEAKAIFNVAVHQTANAIAKEAFLQRLDEVAQLPLAQRTVLMTAGGCGSGKSYALGAIAGDMVSKVGAVWDAAGEQNGTEMPWVLREAADRGIRPLFAYVDADPLTTYDRVLSRATGTAEKPGQGRMVDAQLYAESYAIGAKNFQTFQERHAHEADFLVIQNRGTPKVISNFPAEAHVHGVSDIMRAASERLNQAVRTQQARGPLPKMLLYAMSGATVGERIWRQAA